IYEEGKAPNGYKKLPRWVFLEDGDLRLVPCQAVYGANAGGKSNIIKAFLTFDRLLRFGAGGAFDPNLLIVHNETTYFESSIVLDGSVYTYGIEYSEGKIVHEFLNEGKRPIFEIQNSELVSSVEVSSESYKEKDLKEFLRVECSDKDGVQNRTFLYLMGSKYPGLNKKIADVLDFYLKSVFISLNNQIPAGVGIKMLEDALKNQGQKETAFDKLQEITRKLDFGIERMEINRTKLEKDCAGSEAFAEYLYSFHKDDEQNEVRFNFNQESMGTQIAFGVLGSILAALENGGLVLIDELDRSLHSLVFQQIVQMFTNKRYNTNNAQLIFTAHNTDLLDADILRVSEIDFVNKTKKKGTTVKRLVDFSEVRNVTNFRKRYLSGEFDGIPFPYL
ncbi:MAG: ATP-binding protein, partial [Fibrobacter sp.]|nr:ATP-binding protein [Fibrobacter sp.]